VRTSSAQPLAPSALAECWRTRPMNASRPACTGWPPIGGGGCGKASRWPCSVSGMLILRGCGRWRRRGRWIRTPSCKGRRWPGSASRDCCVHRPRQVSLWRSAERPRPRWLPDRGSNADPMASVPCARRWATAGVSRLRPILKPAFPDSWRWRRILTRMCSGSFGRTAGRPGSSACMWAGSSNPPGRGTFQWCGSMTVTFMGIRLRRRRRPVSR